MITFFKKVNFNDVRRPQSICLSWFAENSCLTANDGQK